MNKNVTRGLETYLHNNNTASSQAYQTMDRESS